MSSPNNSGKRVKAPRCPQCGRRMDLSDAAVMLVGDGGMADPPVWLCRRCWVVVPFEPERLRIVPSAS